MPIRYGCKQIRLLGLSETYVQLLSENTRASASGCQLTVWNTYPGPWMASIQVSRDIVVINGYEATTGQINVDT